MKLTSAVFTFSLPSLGLASVYNTWAFDKVPDAGLNDITFPISMKGAPQKSGYYFAQQFNFHGVPDVGYTGLQPRPRTKQGEIVHAAFSSFQSGTTTNHKNCYQGADGGPGVSCALDIVGDYSHLYHITVENTGGTTWRGTLIDTVTKKSYVVGEWTLPSEAGKLQNGQVGFIEYYAWNDGQTHDDCSKVPFTQVFFGNPTSKTSKARGGRITSVYEDNGCINKIDLTAKQTGKGYRIKLGFE